MSELKLNEMEQVSGGVEVIKPFTEADIRQAAIGFKNQGYDKETLISVLDQLFPGMKSTVKKVVDKAQTPLGRFCWPGRFVSIYIFP